MPVTSVRVWKSGQSSLLPSLLLLVRLTWQSILAEQLVEGLRYSITSVPRLRSKAEMQPIIEGFSIPDNPQAFAGLKASTVSRLPEIAIFTGPNGGGKTRLLKIIAGQAPNYQQWLVRSQHLDDLRRVHSSILARTSIPRANPEQELAHVNRQIAQVEQEVSSLINFQYREIATSPIALYFAPSITDFTDPARLTFAQAAGFLNQGGTIRNISGSFANTLLTVQSLVSNYLISRSEESEFPKGESAELKRKFEGLRELIAALLGMDITWTAGPAISIGGTPLGAISNTFSQGQKWLLHFATNAYADITLDDSILLCLDEPELHLHPAALNQILDILRRTLSHGQILIATHSIPLIAHVGYENTWFVSQGRISYAGRNPETVINGLVGGAAGVGKLRDLLSEPDSAAISRFALESLINPKVVAARSSDPQARQILDSLRAKRDELGRTIRVLDYGAGKGRLLDIAEDEMGGELPSLFDYYAFDPSRENAEICRAAIARVYGSADGKYFGNKSGIAEAIAGQRFDVVVLCNVVHEISPLDWQEEFSFIRTLLNEDGVVLIVEDSLLPHGEHAHGEGFVIASTEALRLLFAVKSQEATMMTTARISYSDTPDRLMCVSIPAKFLSQISRETVQSALTYIKQHASQRIQEIRASGDASFRAGLQHALYLHQFANSTFALKRLT